MDAHSLPARGPDDAAEHATTSPPIGILLVDDREEDLLALAVIVEAPGLRLVKASSGPEALRAVLREDFAVILLDVSMPGMGGFEVAALLKQRERTRHVPIIFLTAESKDGESLYQGYEVGAVDYIEKPIDPEVVRAKVAVFVELHRRGEEIRRQAELLGEVERARGAAAIADLRGTTEQRYRNLADAIPQIVWTAEPGGEASHFNQRWFDYTGLAPAQSLGHGFHAVIHPNDVQRFMDRWQRALHAGEALRAECRLRSAVGAYRWHLCEVLPERDREQRLVGWLGTFTDVHEQKLLEDDRARVLLRELTARAEAEASLRRLEFLAEASNLLGRSLDVRGIVKGLAALVTPQICSWCVVTILAESGAVEHVAFAHEDEALRGLGGDLGRRVEAAGGRRGADQPELSTSPCDPARLAAAIGIEDADLVARLGATSYLAVPLSARGQVLGSMTLVSARADRTYGPADVALAVDLGLRAALAVDNARLYADAQRAVRLRDEFLSIASHELRTPLSALELQAQSVEVQLGRAPVDLGRIGAKVVVMQRQIERLSRLINGLLDVSRIEAGRLELDLETVDLADLIREVAARFAGELERAESELTLDLPEPVPGAWDRLRLDQVVTNLLQNAIKYGQGAPIRVSLRCEDETAVLTVEDHGIGIAAADHRRIFARFERAVSARQYGGMGVGLFIVDRIVRAHAGSIEVLSEPGEGATFVLRLPLEPGEAPRDDDHRRSHEPLSPETPRRG
ncbi:two-component regulator [Minicystis rosea]|nr:two-component regulator [Minicystis rosea]